MKKKTVLTSALSIAMCASLIGGATYALFTSESKVNVVVTSGKVAVDATVGNLKTYSLDKLQTAYSETQSPFENGGLASLTDESSVVVDKITPGDKVTFDIEVENTSNVAIQYRVVVDCESDGDLDGEVLPEDLGLFYGLKISFGEETEKLFTGFGYTEWTLLEQGATISTTSVSIELPKTAGNEYQNKVLTLSYRVEAVQGNAETSNELAVDEEGNYLIYNATDLKMLAALVEAGNTYKGKTVLLMNDIDLNGAPLLPIGNIKTSFQGVFDGQENTVSNFKILGTEGVGLFGVTHGAIKNLSIEQVNVTGNHWVGGIAGYLSGDVDNCHVSNAIISCLPTQENGVWDDGDKVGGIAGYIDANGVEITNSTVSDAKIKGYRDIGGIAGAALYGELTDNSVDNLELSFVAEGEYEDPKTNIGAIAGRVPVTTVLTNSKGTVNNDTASNYLPLLYKGIENGRAPYNGQELEANNVATNVVTYVNDIQQLKMAARYDGKIVLAEDIVGTENNFEYVTGAVSGWGAYATNFTAIPVTRDVTVDLNGKSISMDVGHDAFLTAGKNGVYSMFLVQDRGTLTIEGEGEVNLKADQHVFLIWTCGVGATTYIKDGDFLGEASVCNNCGGESVGQMLYASHGGYICVEGGTYSQNGFVVVEDSSLILFEHGGQETKSDKNYVNHAKTNVEVCGGRFYQYDPSTEGWKLDESGEHYENLMMFGYVTVEENGWYTVVERVTEVNTFEGLKEAIELGGKVVFTENITVTEELNIIAPVKIDLNDKTLTVSRLEAKADTTISGGVLKQGESDYPALSVSAGTLTLNNVKVETCLPCSEYSADGYTSAEYVGVAIWGGACVLNNSDIVVKNEVVRSQNTVIGIGIYGGELTMNGGSIVVETVEATGVTFEVAIFATANDAKTVNLYGVNMVSDSKLEAWGGKTVVNTTDAEGSWEGLCNAAYGGTYEINYVD